MRLRRCGRVGQQRKWPRLLAWTPVLALALYDRAFVSDTDASGHQVGFVSQKRDDNGFLHLIGFWSRVLNNQVSRNWKTEREAWTIVWAARTLRNYLEGRRFWIRSDQSRAVVDLRSVIQ
jgi:hypothetical protein